MFRVAHQLHGAIGFCDETTLSWVSRYSQPLRRLPFGLAGHARPPDRPDSADGASSGLFDGASGTARVAVTYDLPDELTVEADGADPHWSRSTGPTSSTR